MTDIEDRSRRNNVRLVGLPEGAEGSNAAGFLRVNLSRWIPSLKGRDIGIGRARRVCGGEGGSGQPRALIFRVLGWRNRSEILGGARRACPVECAQDNITLLFFPGFGPATAIGRGAFGPVLGRMASLGLRPFLICPAVVELRCGGERRGFGSPQGAVDFVSSLSRQGACAAALRPDGRGLMVGMEAVLAAQEGMMSGCTWMLAEPVFFFLLSSLLLGYCPYLSGTTISLLVRLTPFFLFWRGLMESRFNYNFFLAV